MIVSKMLALALGTWLFLRAPRTRNERGLSQSTENALLLAGAAAIALAIAMFIREYVMDRMPSETFPG